MPRIIIDFNSEPDPIEAEHPDGNADRGEGNGLGSEPDDTPNVGDGGGPVRFKEPRDVPERGGGISDRNERDVGAGGAAALGSTASQDDAAGGWIPGVVAGANAGQFYAEMQERTGNPLWAIPGIAASLWTSETAVDTALTLTLSSARLIGTLGAFAGSLGSALRVRVLARQLRYQYYMTGGRAQWIRFMTYSKTLRKATIGLTFGASGATNLAKIPSPIWRARNISLRSMRVPLAHWRFAERGHIHFFVYDAQQAAKWMYRTGEWGSAISPGIPIVDWFTSDE